MLSVWRIEKESYLKTFLTGEGARLLGGRWNNIGIPVIYTSESLALAAWEKYVRINRTPSGMIPFSHVKLYSIKIKIPDDIKFVDTNKLEFDWINNEILTMQYGSDWASAKSSLVLKVPSKIIPEEFNYIINPLHPKIDQVQIESHEVFSFDSRLLQ